MPSLLSPFLRPVNPGQVTSAYADFQHLSSRDNYTFDVASQNEMGDSVTTSQVFVASSGKREDNIIPL